MSVHRNLIQRLCKQVRAGQHDLRVIGIEATGYRLGIETNTDLYLFGHTFDKQSEAVLHGQLVH
jgi:hypothetical protein